MHITLNVFIRLPAAPGLRMRGIFWVLCALFASLATAAAAVPAFPGAEGFGANSIGGRGGKIIEVTNLDDSGPGSFRAAVEANGPRIVVFRVGGTIELQTEVVLANSFITIAGQTAPGGGITLKTHPGNPRSALTIARGTEHVIIRHLRSRPGPHTGFPKTKSGQAGDASEVKDAIQILGARHVVHAPAAVAMAIDAELAHASANFVGNHVIAPHGEGLHGLAVMGPRTFALFLHDNLGPFRQRDDQPEALFINPKNDGRR